MLIKLIKAQPVDTSFLYDLHADKRVMRGHGEHVPVSAREWRNIISGLYEGYQHTFVIASVSSETSIRLGYIGLHAWSREDRRASVTVSVLPDWQHQGVASAALSMLMELVKTPVEEGGLGLQLVLAHIVGDNVSSRKLFESAGFSHKATVPSFYKMCGRRIDQVIYCWQPN